MSNLIPNIKGTFDILPVGGTTKGRHSAGSQAWRFLEELIHDVMELFHFHEIRTPILERTELISRGVGALTDIVSKEMFAFQRNDDHYVLRPEVTAPVMRAYLQHHLSQEGGVQKLYYIGPCFRAEQPQSGRYRQFHQFGSEVIGTPDPRADAEVIASMMMVYQSVGLEDFRLRINTLGDEDSRPKYKAALQAYFEPHRSSLSEESRARLEKNPLRILDTKNEKERALLADAPLLTDFLGEEGIAHYETVKSLLKEMAIEYVEDPLLVRGLDYYTHTAFELESAQIGAQSALAGGGRYDLLAKDIGSKQPVPAVGFAAGIERLLIAIEKSGIALPGKASPDVFIVSLGADATSWGFVRAQEMRKAGVRVAYDLKGKSMRAQMREANRQNAPLAVIVGDDELAQGQATVKRLDTGDQETVALVDLDAYVQRALEMEASV